MAKKKENKAGKKGGSLTLNLFIILFAIIGSSVLLYPTFSDLYNNWLVSRVKRDYTAVVAEIPEEDYSAVFAEAKAYNDQHQVNVIVDPFAEEDYVLSHPYDTLLNPMGNEIMGYLEIPKIAVDLPIFHGIGAEGLEHGIGHVEGTSLPIGGEGTHAALAGHRGLPTAKILTDADQLVEGDMFYLHILNETLAYKIDQIKVVKPENSDDLALVEGEDYVTLITCTPYGVNSHRMLIRGTRVPYVEEEKEEATPITYVEHMQLAPRLLLIGLCVLLVIFIILFFIDRKNKRQAKREARLKELNQNADKN